MLNINNLHVNIHNKEILKGVDLTLEKGKVHVIMGPNGSGKSTLSKALTGHYETEVTQGNVLIEDENLLLLEPEERAHRGLFLSFQHPVEIPGVNNAYFLRHSLNAKREFEGKNPLNAAEFLRLLRSNLERLGMNNEMISRSLNDGFSGGEKKRNEILQMEVLDPKVIILDEIDSGLDVDALKAVAEGINRVRDDENTFLIITHYSRILSYVKPDYIHILYNGKIVQTGGMELADSLEEQGFEAVIGEGYETRSA